MKTALSLLRVGGANSNEYSQLVSKEGACRQKMMF